MRDSAQPRARAGRFVVLAAATAWVAMRAAVGNAAPASTGPVFLPYVTPLDGCATLIAVQNLGASAVKAVVVTFDESRSECDAPGGVVCSGLIASGGAWRFAPGDLSPTARSAVVFGLSARTRADLSLPPPDDIAADAICSSLRAGLDCATYTAFLAAFLNGETWQGWPLAEVAVGPLSVRIDNQCPSGTRPGAMVSAGYSVTAGMAATEAVLPGSSDGRVWVQNAGTEAVDVTVQSRNAACASSDCPAVRIAPGASASVEASACTSAQGGAVWLSAGGPIVSVEDRLAGQFTLEAGEPLFPSEVEPVPQSWFGPLVFDPTREWESSVELTNLDASQDAEVKVMWLDGAGREQTTDALSICPRGFGRATLSSDLQRSGTRAGSVRVLVSGGARVAGTVTSRQLDGPFRDGQTVSYPLVPDPTMPPLAGGRPLALALEAADKDLDAELGSSAEIVLSNPALEPGWVDTALLVYDQNSLSGVMCHRLAQGETRYISLDSLGATQVGVRGSVAIVPTDWSGGPDGVGIAAVVVHRYGTRPGEDIPGDEISASAGVPFAASDALLAAADGNCTSGGAYVRTPSAPTFLPGPAAAVSYAPALAIAVQSPECVAGLRVRNTASQTRSAVVVLTYGSEEDCSCPLDWAVFCTGPIAPGEFWEPPPGEPMVGASAAAVYGFAQVATATQICAALTENHDCDTMRRFRLAYGTGGAFDGLDLAGAEGGGLRTEVTRRCQPLAPGQEVVATYVADTHPVEPGGDSVRSFAFVLATREDSETVFHIQNVGLECTEIRLLYQARGDCLRERTCTTGGVSPGSSVVVPAWDCVGPSFRGSVVIQAREPIVVKAELLAPSGTVMHGSFPGPVPEDVDGDGQASGADVARVQAALGTTSASPAWQGRLDLRPDGAISDEDVNIVRAELCGLDQARPNVAQVPADQHVLMPLLAEEAITCRLGITLQNLGPEETGAVLVFFGTSTDPSCAPPIAVLCSPALAPGASWFLPGDEIRATGGGPVLDPTSGIAFSFTTRNVREFVDLGFDESVHILMCESLWLAVTGDCVDYAAFKAAWDTGGSFAGVPLGATKGSPIAISVARDCRGQGSERDERTGYLGVGTGQLSGGGRAASYMYRLPLVADRPFHETSVFVQNDGSLPATVQVALRAQDDCSVERLCPPVALAPGASVEAACAMEPDFQGSARVESDQPVAVAALLRWTIDEGAAAAYTALGTVAGDARGRTAESSSLSASGALAWSSDAGADVGVQVQNLSETDSAQVQVTFRDDRGAPVFVLEDFICADGAQSFFLPVEQAEANVPPGSVEVRSVGYRGTGMVRAAPISGAVFTMRWLEAARFTLSDASAYELAAGPLAAPDVHGSPAVVLPAPGEAELTDVPDGVAILAVPGLIDDPASDTSTALVVSNRIPVRGDTGVAIGIFDANGLVATRCLLLGASETAYLDADLLGLPAGFKGSAVISAVTWDHPTSHDGVDRNLVGLAADLVRRSRSANADQAADVAHTAGVPLLGPGSELTRALICGEFPPRPTSTPTRLPGVYLPMVEVPPRATPTP